MTIVGMAPAGATSAWDIISTVADSIAGLGTLGALIVAVIVYRRQVNDARRLQASRVLIEVPHPDDGTDELALIVRNVSDLPIYSIHVRYGHRPNWILPITIEHSLAAGDVFRISLVGWEHDIWKTADILFRDAAGNYWRRTAGGQLSGTSLKKAAAGK